MAINPKNLISEIYNLKSQWSTANQNGDETAKNNAATKAQEYYKQLEDNGYADVSNQLRNADLTTAKDILNKYSTSGMTPTRDYLYSLGKNHNMSRAEVDNIIGWNNDTGEISIGGKNVGRPDASYNGKTYWNGTDVLDSAFKDYANRSGLNNTPKVTAGEVKPQTSASNSKINELWGIQKDDHNNTQDLWVKEYRDLKKTNPFTTEEAKAILAKYDLAGLQGRDNAAASGGASNGGNIDSYAASNALRQQAALVNQGQMVVLDAHQQKLDNARAILEGLGAYQKDSRLGMQNTIGLQQTEEQRQFENDETAKNNEIARMAEQARVSGYTPSEWVIKNDDVYSRFLNADGSFKKEMENVDIQALINSAKASGDTETAKKLAVVRGKKILDNYDTYGKYSNAGDISFMSPERTAEYNLTDKQIKSAEKIAQASNETNLALADKENVAKMEQLKLQIEANKASGGDPMQAYDVMMNRFEIDDTGPRNYVRDIIKPYIESGDEYRKPDILSDITNPENCKKYNIDVSDAIAILNMLGIYDYDDYIRENYEDVPDDPATEENEVLHGMRPKNN